MPATGTAPGPDTAYGVNITITTNSNPGNPQVTGINGKCMAQDGVTVLRRFSGMGNGASAREIFGDVVTNCLVNFYWAEQQPGTNITCAGFTLTVSNPNSNAQASPFPVTSFVTPTTFSIPPGGRLFGTTVVNGNATWDYEGTITTQVGTAAPQTMSYDPEVIIEDLDSGSK